MGKATSIMALMYHQTPYQSGRAADDINCSQSIVWIKTNARGSPARVRTKHRPLNFAFPFSLYGVGLLLGETSTRCGRGSREHANGMRFSSAFLLLLAERGKRADAYGDTGKTAAMRSNWRRKASPYT